MSDTINIQAASRANASPLQNPNTLPSEKTINPDLATGNHPRESSAEQPAPSKETVTLVSQLWTWMRTGSGSGKAEASCQDNDIEAMDEKSLHKQAGTQLRDDEEMGQHEVGQGEERTSIIDQPRESGWKYKGIAPSRGTHRDYPSSKDALWTGGGNRQVPEGLRKMAAGEEGGGGDGAGSSAPPGAGGDDAGEGDGGDRGRDDREREEEREERDVRGFRRERESRNRRAQPVWPPRDGAKSLTVGRSLMKSLAF